MIERATFLGVAAGTGDGRSRVRATGATIGYGAMSRYFCGRM
jgi:hypothetical protein